MFTVIMKKLKCFFIKIHTVNRSMSQIQKSGSGSGSGSGSVVRDPHGSSGEIDCPAQEGKRVIKVKYNKRKGLCRV